MIYNMGNVQGITGDITTRLAWHKGEQTYLLFLSEPSAACRPDR